MRKRSSFFIRPKLAVMTEAEILSLCDGALEVLERVGVKVMHPEALDLLVKAGGGVGADSVVRLKPSGVERAIATAPKKLAIYDRDGSEVMVLGGENTGGFNTYYGTGSDLLNTYDPFSGELRLTVSEDIANMAKLVDRLPNMDFIMSYGIPSDVPPDRVFRTEFLQMVKNSTKPIVFTSDNGPDCRKIIEMAALVAGGHEQLKQKPFVLSYAQPTSPLQHSHDALEKLLVCAEFEVPLCYPPGMMPGGTAPATMAGAITQSLAESFSGLVIHQAKKPGAPIVLCGAHGCFDMRTAINVYAAPERLMTEAALASIYQYFGIPTFGMGGCTDAQVLDEQAGAECGMMALWAALTGINLAHDAGYLGSGMIGDLRAIVLNDEVNSYVRHVLVRGLIVNDDTRAIEALAHLGPGGHFLADEHTVDHFRTEFWFPTLFNRLTLGTWIEKGKKSTKELLAEKVRQILSSHQPKALPATIISQLEKMAGC